MASYFEIYDDQENKTVPRKHPTKKQTRSVLGEISQNTTRRSTRISNSNEYQVFPQSTGKPQIINVISDKENALSGHPVAKSSQNILESRVPFSKSSLNVQESRVPFSVIAAKSEVSHDSDSSLSINEDSLNNSVFFDTSEDEEPIQLPNDNHYVDDMLTFSEYSPEIYKFLKDRESLAMPKWNYMERQTDMTFSMRGIVVNWLVEVAEEYKLHNETLHLAVSYIDRFLSHMNVERSKLQLLGTTCMFIAAKYEEIYPPRVGEFAFITDNTYTKKQVDDIAQSGDPLVDVEVEGTGEKKVEKEETFDAREWKEQVDVGSKPGRSKDLATPAVSRIGMEHNVKLADVTGTGKVTCTDFNADSGDDGVPVVESIDRDPTATVSKLYTLESSGEEIFRMDIAMSPPQIVSASLTGPGVGISAGGSVPGTSNSCVRNKNSKDMEKEKNEMTKEELQYIDEKMKMSFGGEMSEYQKIRKNNIVERVVKMREALADIQQLKRKIFEENEAGKKRKGTDEAKPAKKIKVDNFEQRRSSRPKKPANYFVKEDDPDWEPPSKRKKGKKRKRDPFDDDPDWETPSKKKNIIWDPSKERKALSPGQPSSEESRGISIRTEKEAIYASTEPREDDFVFCQTCKKLMYHGCEQHPFIFDYDAKLEIGPSKAGKNAGRGVFNVDRQRSIPENVMFGPYDGDFYTVEEYNILMKEGGESGYAWELRSEDNMDIIVGYFDPGSNPNPKEAWMPMVNMATKDRHQNVVAIQFHGKIYYKTLCAISYGQEILVDYGASYGKEMGIKIEEKSLYELKENWTREGVSCTHCGKLFVNENALLDHLNPTRGGEGRVAGCTALLLERNREDVMNGILSHVCEQCGRGFKCLSKLERHKLVHTNEKPFSCPDCGKLYKYNASLNAHIKSLHSEDPETFPCSWCKKEFIRKHDLNVHWNTVCDREEPYLKCAECGIEFNCTGALNQHVKAVHRREFGHKCDECGKRFVSQGEVNKHIKTAHSSERPFKCDDCEASYKCANSLDHHRIRTHTKQYYWNCDVCERGFLKPKEVKDHMVAKHPIEYAEQLKREKPFVCKKCQKMFSSQEEVATHDKKMHNV